MELRRGAHGVRGRNWGGRGGRGMVTVVGAGARFQKHNETYVFANTDPVDRCFFTRGPWWTVNQGSVDRCFFTRGPWWTVVSKENIKRFNLSFIEITVHA